MLSWALMSLLFFMFYSACLNPSHQVLIDVNAYGEMRIEIVLFAVIWIMTTVNVVVLWKRAGQSEPNENHRAESSTSSGFSPSLNVSSTDI